MLALKLGLSLVSSNSPGGWSPDDESSLEAWYQNKVGITLNGSDVSRWADSAPAGLYDMVQNTLTEQPAYNAGTGALSFVSSNDNNMDTTGQISLEGDFTIGIRISPDSPIFDAGTFLADNDTGKELFKYQTDSRITVKIDLSGATNLDLDSGTFGDDYLVITRVSNVLLLWKNGARQTGTMPTLEGTADIDAIGIRYGAAGDIDPFNGTIKEIQIYSSSSAALTANINDRLATL